MFDNWNFQVFVNCSSYLSAAFVTESETLLYICDISPLWIHSLVLPFSRKVQVHFWLYGQNWKWNKGILCNWVSHSRPTWMLDDKLRAVWPLSVEKSTHLSFLRNQMNALLKCIFNICWQKVDQKWLRNQLNGISKLETMDPSRWALRQLFLAPKGRSGGGEPFCRHIFSSEQGIMLVSKCYHNGVFFFY